MLPNHELAKSRVPPFTMEEITMPSFENIMFSKELAYENDLVPST